MKPRLCRHVAASLQRACNLIAVGERETANNPFKSFAAVTVENKKPARLSGL
jgi:hypothetical protein